MMRFIKKRPYLFAILALTIGSALVWFQVVQLAPSGVLRVAMLNVGQGDAIFIETPNGNQILIDSGTGAKIIKELSQQMSFFDNSIEMIVVTNPDKDHIGGFITVLKKYDVGVVLEPGTISNTAVSKNLGKAIDAEVALGAKRIIARRGMDFLLDTDVHLLILFPDKDASKMSTNDGSIIAKLVYKNTSVMLTGDAPEKIEKYLIELENIAETTGAFASTSIARLDSDILKVGHHGSKTSTGDVFIKAVSPQYALISVGKNNRYGHPTPETLGRLSAHGVQTLVTAQDGTIIFESDGERWHRK